VGIERDVDRLFPTTAEVIKPHIKCNVGGVASVPDPILGAKTM